MNYPPTAEFKLVPVREIAPPSSRPMGDTPERAVEYWRQHVQSSPMYRDTSENFAVVFLNVRRRITGHYICATGTLDTILVHARDVFHAAILANAAAIIIGHNHPSGDPTASEADIKVTRDLIKAGSILRIDVLDHVIIGHPAEGKGYSSLRELGYFYS